MKCALCGDRDDLAAVTGSASVAATALLPVLFRSLLLRPMVPFHDLLHVLQVELLRVRMHGHIEDDRTVIWSHVLVTYAAVDELRVAVGRATISFVDVREDVIFRLYSLADRIQQLHTSHPLPVLHHVAVTEWRCG